MVSSLSVKPSLPVHLLRAILGGLPRRCYRGDVPGSRRSSIFPLLNYDAKSSRVLRQVLNGLRAQGYCAETRRVPYEFQKGGNRLLSVVRKVR